MVSIGKLRATGIALNFVTSLGLSNVILYKNRKPVMMPLMVVPVSPSFTKNNWNSRNYSRVVFSGKCCKYSHYQTSTNLSGRPS